ncbi:retrovirus-related pol polyprotein from transposon TNT 1-94 [Tanacetum coccineum]
MLTRAMAKELSVASAHECLFVDFLSEEEPKKVSEALHHPGWVDAMQDELNQFSRNKVWTLVPEPYGKAPKVLRGKLVCCSAKKQQSVVMSSAEAEYLVPAGCCANILWMKSQLTNYDIIYEKVSTPTGGIRLSIGYSGEIGAKGTLKKSFLPPRWKLLMGKNPGAKSGLRRKQSSKHTFESKTEASKSKSGHLEKETQTSLAMVKSPSHPLPPTPVVGEMHKKAQQATGGPTSLGATSKEGANPKLSSGTNLIVLVDQTKSAEDRSLEKIHRSDILHSDFPKMRPLIISDKSEEEEEVDKDKDTHASSHDVPKDKLEQQKAKSKSEISSLKSISYPDINQLTDLLVSSLKPEFSKLLASHDFAGCLPTELKELPLKLTKLSREIKELKKHIKDMEIGLPGDLKEIPTKLENFTSIISSLTSQMLKRRKSSKIINYDVLTQKGPITLQVYREDGTVEVISNVKVSDLHQAEWKEEVQACPDRKEKGWKTIYDKDKNGIP